MRPRFNLVCVFSFPPFHSLHAEEKRLENPLRSFFVSIVRNILILPEVELYSPRRKCIKKKTWADECTYSIFHNKLDSRPIKGCISGFYNISQTVVINMKCLLTLNISPDSPWISVGEYDDTDPHPRCRVCLHCVPPPLEILAQHQGRSFSDHRSPDG